MLLLATPSAGAGIEFFSRLPTCLGLHQTYCIAPVAALQVRRRQQEEQQRRLQELRSHQADLSQAYTSLEVSLA